VINLFEKENKNINGLTRFVFKPSIFKIIEKEKFILGKDIADIDVLNKLKQQNDVIYYEIKGEFFDIGNPLNFLKTNTVFGINNPEISNEYKKFLIELLKNDISNNQKNI
jgi:UTP--glucose-1-phosphate uridylyltransferase